MTSRIAANALLHELSFYDGAAIQADESRAFAFALDFESERVWPDMPFDTSSSLARYPLPDRDEVLEIVEAVARLSGARAPRALNFINAHMKTVLLRRSGAIADASSASNREHVGFCVLTNMHVPADRVLLCAEALVHESIHQYLYKTEAQTGNFCDLSEARTYRSPWSGKRIPLHSLIHACFVWYGLLTFWCQLARSADVGEEASLIGDNAARVMFGFAFVRQMLAGPAFPLGSVDPEILAVIDRMAQVVPALDCPVVEQRTTLHDLLRRWESGDWARHLATSLERVEALDTA
jgi:HEXXH motif-containing protein